MIENKEKFAQIEGLFWGDIEQEEQEISWIEQADISPLLDAMPKLKDLKIKGTNNLRFGKDFTAGVAVTGNYQWWPAY